MTDDAADVGGRKEQDVKLMSLASVAHAQHVALSIERSLRKTNDAAERMRLRHLRDWHFAQLRDEQIKRGASYDDAVDTAREREHDVVSAARRLVAKIRAEELNGTPIHPAGCPDFVWTLGDDDGRGYYPHEYVALADALDVLDEYDTTEAQP